MNLTRKFLASIVGILAVVVVTFSNREDIATICWAIAIIVTSFNGSQAAVNVLLSKGAKTNGSRFRR